jgi:hypothetical protein
MGDRIEHFYKYASYRRSEMKIVGTVVGILLILAGAVWFLQGINVIGGSMMTGQSQWAVYGSITLVIGVALLLYANRNRIFHS